jgi:hypothetical protein
MLRHDFFEIGKHDPLGLNTYFEDLVDTGNPYYAWLTIELCIKHEKEFPNWLRRYLLQCAERMQSGDAKKTGDLRKVLPWVFGFSKKSGPGSLLDPDKDVAGTIERRGFAFHFATKIEQGERPSTALVSACNETFDQRRADKINEKTLRSWIVKEFGLKRWPHTPAEWESVKSIGRERFGRYWSFLKRRQTQKQSPTRSHHQIGKRSREIAP